jgi:hypothetical protein
MWYYRYFIIPLIVVIIGGVTVEIIKTTLLAQQPQHISPTSPVANSPPFISPGASPLSAPASVTHKQPIQNGSYAGIPTRLITGTDKAPDTVARIWQLIIAEGRPQKIYIYLYGELYYGLAIDGDFVSDGSFEGRTRILSAKLTYLPDDIKFYFTTDPRVIDFSYGDGRRNGRGTLYRCLTSTTIDEIENCAKNHLQ